jgi:hypothetical protein
MRYPDFYVTPKPDGSFHVVTQRPAISLFRAVCLALFIVGFFVGLFQAHFMTAFGFLVMFGIFMPNLAKRRRAAAKNAGKL